MGRKFALFPAISLVPKRGLDTEYLISTFQKEYDFIKYSYLAWKVDIITLMLGKSWTECIKYLAQGYTASGGIGLWFPYLREYTNCEYIPLKKKYV